MRRTTEDYLKTIYVLSQKSGGVRGVSIAEELGVSRPTVSIIVRRLETEGYITKSGKDIAKSTLERHNTFEPLLTELGVYKKIAASDACRMEHAVSPESYEALKQLAEEA